MLEQKMTDNEIIEAVNYCAGVSDLINRLYKENKEKDEMLKAQADTIFLYERVIKNKATEVIKNFVDKLKENIYLVHIGDDAPLRVIQEVTLDRLVSERLCREE